MNKIIGNIVRWLLIIGLLVVVFNHAHWSVGTSLTLIFIYTELQTNFDEMILERLDDEFNNDLSELKSLINKHMSNTPNSLIESKLEEFDNLADYRFISQQNREEIRFIHKQALLEAQQQARREVYEDLFREIKDYDFKEKHICGFNDGKQDCDCFIAGLNVALQIIKTNRNIYVKNVL